MRLDPAIYRDLLLSLLPELVLTGWALVLLLFVAWRHRTARDLRIAGWLTLLALLSTAVATWWLWWNRAGVQGVVTMIAADDFRWVADWVFLGAAALTVLISFAYLQREQLLVPEYYVLLIFGTLGMMVMAAGADLMVIFLGLELMSVAVYVLAGIDRRRRLGISAVRHRARVWCDRVDESWPDRHAGRPHGQAERHVAGRSGAVDRGFCIQDRGGAVPHVGAGRL